MRVLFEPGSGRLRLDPRAAGTLIAWAEGEEPDQAGLRALTEAGVLTDERPHPSIAPALETMTDPEHLLTLEVGYPDGSPVERGAGWLGTDCATLLLDLPGDLVELIGLAPMFVPAALARIVRLAPRPALDRTEEITIDRESLDRLLDPGRHSDIDVTPPLENTEPTLLAGRLRDPATRHWRMSLRHPDGTTSLHVIDTPAGLWTTTTGGAGPTVLQPVSSTTVWRLILRLFPRAEHA